MAFDINMQRENSKILNQILEKDFEDLTRQEQNTCNKALLDRLLIEFRKQDRSGIYGFTQRKLAYNSSRIEGSTLTEDQTSLLFETRTLYGDDIFRMKDVEEMNGHFSMFNKMLTAIQEPLSENIIKSLHYELKIGVFEDRANGYNIGEYKSRANRVGNIETSRPDMVQNDIQNLLTWYHNADINIETIALLHAKYENIHPFQDGNGRTGRILLFRECLKNSCIPLIISDDAKLEYIKVLYEAQTTGQINGLVNLFEKYQKDYYKEMQFYLRDYVI